mgnify:CR=1 FL=1
MTNIKSIKVLNTPKSIKGAITIIMALVMLALALASTIYTAKSKFLDIRIASAEIRKNQAILSAETGLERAIAQLDVQPNFVPEPGYSTSIVDTIDSSIFDVTLTVMRYATAAVANTPLATFGNGTGNDRFILISSIGYSDDRTAVRTLEQKVWVHPLANGSPASAITVSGGMGIGGTFTVGASPNGGGLGVPLSVWSDEPVGVTGNGASCGLEEFDAGDCSTYSYSDKNNTGADIFDDTLVSAGGTFPNDVFDYTFGYPSSDYQAYKDQAEELVSNCAGLNAASVGLIWVTGDCTINGGTIVGSATTPVILVIEDSNLQLNGGSLIYGIVFSFTTPGGIGGGISMTGNSTIRGAFLSDHAIDISGGTFDTRYDQNVLDIIANGGSDAYSAVEPISGSWKDF